MSAILNFLQTIKMKGFTRRLKIEYIEGTLYKIKDGKIWLQKYTNDFLF